MKHRKTVLFEWYAREFPRFTCDVLNNVFLIRHEIMPSSSPVQAVMSPSKHTLHRDSTVAHRNALVYSVAHISPKRSIVDRVRKSADLKTDERKKNWYYIFLYM